MLAGVFGQVKHCTGNIDQNAQRLTNICASASAGEDTWGLQDTHVLLRYVSASCSNVRLPQEAIACRKSLLA